MTSQIFHGLKKAISFFLCATYFSCWYWIQVLIRMKAQAFKFAKLVFCILLFGVFPRYANAQYTSFNWDAILSNKNYYDPVPNLVAQQATTGAGLNNPYVVGDSTTWAFGQVVNGQWTGTAIGHLSIDHQTPTVSNLTLSGSINSAGDWKILFTNTSSGAVTIGIGIMKLVDGVWSPIAQTITNPDPVTAHWAYNVPYDPSTTIPPTANLYTAYPSTTSPMYSWIKGTTWTIQNGSLFGSSSSGTLSFTGFNNGFIWGLGSGPNSTSYTSLGSVTPYGNVLLGFLKNGVMSAMWGTITSNPFYSVMNLADYGYGTTTGTANGDTATLTYYSTLGIDTNNSLVQTANALQSQFGNQLNAVITGLTYDCNLFGGNDVCISTGGRNTLNSDPTINTVSALLIGGYRINNAFRVGAYLDQNLSATSSNGITNMSNSTPMGGVFGVWNEKADRTGLEVKASLGYNSKGMTVNRPTVGTSEAGSGSTNLTSQGAAINFKYGMEIGNKTIVSPYVGLRYTTTTMGGYSEGANASVLYPLAYSSLSMNATTALAGIGATYKLDEQWSFIGSGGVEADTQTSVGSYTVTNYAGLNPVTLNPSPSNVRPTATLAAYYAVGKNARIGLTGMYRQDSFTGMSSTTGLITYTIGL
jgi:hypothetical protein